MCKVNYTFFTGAEFKTTLLIGLTGSSFFCWKMLINEVNLRGPCGPCGRLNVELLIGLFSSPLNAGLLRNLFAIRFSCCICSSSRFFSSSSACLSHRFFFFCKLTAFASIAFSSSISLRFLAVNLSSTCSSCCLAPCSVAYSCSCLANQSLGLTNALASLTYIFSERTKVVLKKNYIKRMCGKVDEKKSLFNVKCGKSLR